MRAQLGDRRCDRIPDTLISVGRNTRRGECTAASDARAIGTLSHSFPSSVTLAKGLCWLGCGNVKYNEALEAMRAQLGEHRNPVTHSSPSSVTLARALARLRQREASQKLDEAMLRRCVRSSAMIATLTHLDTLISSSSHTRKSAMLWLGCHRSAKLAKLDEAMRAQLAMIGTLTH